MTETPEFPTENQTEVSSKGKRTWRSRRVLIPVVAVIAVLGAGGAVWASAVDNDLGGDQRDKAAQAAVAAVGGGTVTEAEEEDGFYEVDVTREDGTEVDVLLDKGFEVVSTKEDGPDSDAEDRPLSAAESTAAKKAALAEIGSGTVSDVERDDDGGADGYEVEVTKADATEWSVRLDKDFGVLSSKRDD